MEDDIDIEEHDVLDNPKIRDIFPDLSLVKTEVPDNEDDIQEEEYSNELDYGLNIKIENTNFDENNEENHSFQYEQNESEHNIDEYLQNIEHNNSDIDQIEDDDYEFDQTENTNEFSFTNKIILGSKPGYDELYEEALHSNTTVYLEDWEFKLKNSPCYCPDCEILFPTVNALDAHKSVSHSFLVALDLPRCNTARKSTAPSKYCNHCDKTFPNDTALIKHLYELLPLNKFQNTPEPVKVVAKTPYKCIKCNKYFQTFAAGKEHKKNVHPTLNNVNIICRVVTKTEKPETVVAKKDNAEGKLFSMSLIPQSVLFQCNICQVSFVSCFSAMQHARRCSNNTEYTKCGICKRKIRAKDTYIHELQHKYMPMSAKLRIFSINKSIYERVFYKCPKCSICFDEKGFWYHYERCNRQRANFTRCTVCHVDISNTRFTNHKSRHSLNKYTKKDFVIISLYQLKETSPIKSPINSNAALDKIKLYYCHICGSNKNVLSQKGHKNGSCKTLKVVFCELCGLGFGTENHRLHKTLHNERDISLDDYTIINLFNGLEMELPLPNFHCCKHCKIHFLSIDKCLMHSCAKEPYEFCEICNKKFDLKSFKPHSDFHTFNKIPELLKKYNSINNMWNVVYQCNSCELVSVTYDSAVTHSQNHINELPRPLSKKCYICEFDIVEEHYKLHMKHHDNNVKIDRSQFKVLMYNFENLYSKEWMNMFASLPKAHKYQILSKSIYRITRRFKLNYEINPQSDDYKFFCLKCKTNIEMEETKKHYFDKKCKISSKFVCKICNLQFNTLQQCILHENIHESVAKTYKIITFNDKKDELFDQRLKDFELSLTKIPIKIQPQTSKPPTTSQKSSKPTKFNTKNTKFSAKITKLSTKITKSSTKISKPPIGGKLRKKQSVTEIIKLANRIKLYKCNKCESCVSRKTNIDKHKCSMFGKSRNRYCNICKQSFYNPHYHLHMEIHRQFPKLKKPLVINFSPTSKLLPTATIFQCECGLHFTSKQSIDRHIEICEDNVDISKETCSKCNLVFPTDVLVTHLCKHHSKPVDIKVQLVKNNNKKGQYQCSDCSVIFTNMTNFDDHLFNCISQAKGFKKCSKCNLNFDQKSFDGHDCVFDQKTAVVKKTAAVTTVFKCSKCNICYLNKKSISYHFEVKHVNRRDIISCENCKLRFTPQGHKKHILIHNKEENYMIKVIDTKTGRSTLLKGKNNKTKRKKAKTIEDSLLSRKNIAKKSPKTVVQKTSLKKRSDIFDQETAIDQQIDNVVDSQAKCKLYRCSACNTCFSLQSRLDFHLTLNHDYKRNYSTCNICGLRFHSKLAVKHNILHNQYTEYVFEIIESDTGETTIVKGKNTELDDKIANTRKRGNKHLQTLDVGIKKKRFRRNNDAIALTDHNTSESKMDFESVNLNDNDTTLTDDIESVIDNSSVIDPLNNTESILSDIDTDVTRTDKNMSEKGPKTLSNKEKGMIESKISHYGSNLYKCGVCDLHFLTETTIDWHLRKEHTKIQAPHTCEICDLAFSYHTLARHGYIHHTRLNIQNKDEFTILEYDYDRMPNLYASKKNATDNEEITRVTKIAKKSATKVVKSATKVVKKSATRVVKKSATKVLKKSATKVAKKPIAPVILNDVIEVEPIASVNLNDVEEVKNIQTNTKIHYFKCGDCNVCFIDEKTCREHSLRHVCLDPKTYIECKICNFQFLIDSLKNHMTMHHSFEFSLEDLIITEFSSTGDSNPRIDVYQGIDKVQSRLVSTTTDVVV